MRVRHTLRTEPVDNPAVQITFRASQELVDRIDQAIGTNIPDVRSRTDLIQDALWLWLHEWSITQGK